MAAFAEEGKVPGASDHEDTSVQTLAGNGLQEVPKRFIRSDTELASFSPHTTLSLEPIPMIDLEGLHDYRRQFTMAAISSACRHWGCFQVVNHEIPQPILDDALRAAREFFEMTPKEKQAYKMELDNPYGSGYGIQSLESEDKVLDWGDVMFHKNMEKWPAKPATYKSAMVGYARETRKVLEALLDVVSMELRLMPTYFRDRFGDFEQRLRVNYYPSCPQPELVLGLRSHTDPVVFTALLEDQTRGLQVKNGDKWVTVDPEPDALVILVGDQLQIASNGRFKSATHRAVVNKDTDRISIAMGLAPNSEVMVRPAPELLDKGSPARYEGRTYGEFKAALPHGVRCMVQRQRPPIQHHYRPKHALLESKEMGRPLTQDGYASIFSATTQVRNALEELINAFDIHPPGPKLPRPESCRGLRVRKPFLPPGSSSNFANTRPNPNQLASKPACTAMSECRGDINLPVCATTTNSPALINSCAAGRTFTDMEKVQSRLAKLQKKTSGGNTSPNSECCGVFSRQVNPLAVITGESFQAPRPRSRSSVPCTSRQFD